jgi:anti-anti-sigma regulatory factor
MNIVVEHAEGRVPVTILRLEGDLDAATFEALIEAGTAAHAEGATHILVDMRKVPYMGSSGIVALHSIALTLNDQAPPDLDSGWQAHHAISQSVDGGMQDRLKVLLPDRPNSSIARVLGRTGMDRFIETHTDEAAAIASF